MFSFVSIRFCLFTSSRGDVSLVNKFGVENAQNFPSPHVVSGITGGHKDATDRSFRMAAVQLIRVPELSYGPEGEKEKRNVRVTGNMKGTHNQSTLSEEGNVSPAFSSCFIALICQIIHAALEHR